MYHRLTGLLAAGNYFVRYLFGAAGTAACVPAIEMIGVGWFSTLTSILVVFSTGGVYLTVFVWSQSEGENRVKENCSTLGFTCPS